MISDLNILALRYALGELPVADATAFENRLATDQLAREALADAVLLTAAVRQLPAIASVARPVRPAASRRSRVAATIACAAAVLLVVVLFKVPETELTAGRRATREATALVGTWSELGDDAPGASELDNDFSEDDVSAEIPDWMVAAVLDVVDVAPRDEGTL